MVILFPKNNSLNEKISKHIAAGNQPLIEEKVVNMITLDYQKEVD